MRVTEYETGEIELRHDEDHGDGAEPQQKCGLIRIEYVTPGGFLSVVERPAPPLLHQQDALSIQMALCSMAGQMIPSLASQIHSGPEHVNAPQCQCGLCGMLGGEDYHEPHWVEASAMAPDGTVYWARVDAGPLIDLHGEADGIDAAMAQAERRAKALSDMR